MVRAKFRVTYIGPYEDGSKHIYMTAVYSDDPNDVNKRFSDATPNGNFNMVIRAAGPHDYFEQGKEYYLDFTKVKY